MARFPVAPFTKGLSTLVDTAAGDPQASPDLKDVRGHTGILTLRKGYRVLDIEPSHVSGLSNKTRLSLDFDGVNDRAASTTFAVTLGAKWTMRWECAFAISGNDTDGTRTMLLMVGALAPLEFQAIGVTADSTIKLRAIIKTPTETMTLDSAARTVAAWQSLGSFSSARYIRLTRDGNTMTMYVGETSVATGTATWGNALHDVSTALYLGDNAGSTAPCKMQIFSNLVFKNSVLSEGDAYWGISWPTDTAIEQDVLGNWPFNEGILITAKDYSKGAFDLTISGATWTGNTNTAARGLGLTSWRRSNGDIYHTLACGRRGLSSASAVPSGAVYSWKATTNFTPFYIGGTSLNDDSTAGLDTLDPFARMDFAQGRDMLIMSNGVDFCRKYQSAYKYLGGTAPPTAPVVVTSGGSGITATWLYAYSYYNPTEGTETGLSPSTSISIIDDVGCSVTFFDSSDTQFTKVRIYRSQTGEPTLYLLTEVAAASGAYADTKTDANLARGPLCAGGDLPGNRNRKRAYLGFPDFPNTPTLYFTSRGNNTRINPPGSSKGPGNAPSVGNGAAGSVNAGVHYWAYSYYDSVNDVETGMSPATAFNASGGAIAAITTLVLPPEGSRYDKMRLYRTKAAGVVWYLAQTFTAAVAVNETQADAALTATIETRCLPPRFTGMAVFANRLWGFRGPTLYWSVAGQFEDHPEANGFAPKAGVDITAICATDGALFAHFQDGTIHLLPHPGDEPDLSYFVPLNLKQWSPIGAAIGHFTAQAVPGGVIWLAKDGFYFANPTTLDKISRTIDPTLATLNAARGAYACALYDTARRTYRCWLSRGSNRLNEECFVYYLDDGTWWLDSIHADAAGILYDAQEVPHRCFLVENGVLMELDETLDYDGDGTGTLTGTIASPGITHYTEIGSYTAPTGGDGGYPVWFVKSDGTTVQRFRLDNAIGVSPVTFYPSYSGLVSGTWTAYYHGIRGYIKTMLLSLGDMRHLKNIQHIFFFNRVQSAGGLQVNLAADEGTLTAVSQDVDLTKPVSQVTTLTGSGRTFQLEIYSDPPAASRPWGLKGVEVEATVDKSDAGS